MTEELTASQKFIALNNLKVDYDHWKSMSSWTCTETIFIINGIDPVKALVKRSLFLDLETLYGDGLTCRYDVFIKIEKQINLIGRAKNDGHLSDRNKPITALTWCMQEGIEVPEECVNAVKAQVDKRAEWQAITEALRQNSEGETEDQADAQKAGETKTENLLRLIGLLKNMLADEKLIKDLTRDPTGFSKQKDLVQYISGLYAEDHPNKGLQVSKLNQILSAANQVLKDDKEP
jgi:hypothetical protein